MMIIVYLRALLLSDDEWPRMSHVCLSTHMYMMYTHYTATFSAIETAILLVCVCGTVYRTLPTHEQ